MTLVALRGRRHKSIQPWHYRLLVTAYRFNRKIFLLILALLWFVFSLQGWAQVQFLDVIYLKDGQSFKGLIIEQTPEGLFRLETLSGSVLSFAGEEIERVLKEKTPGTPAGVQYRDVVFLKDGIIFRGTIVEQVLGECITLQTENDVLLSLRLNEIWKIVKEKRLAGVGEAEQELEGADIDDLKRQVQLSLDVRAETVAMADSAGELEAERGELEEEIERLKEQVQESEGALEEELETINSELQSLLDELMEMTKGMWTEEIVGESGGYKQTVPGLKDGFEDLWNDLLEAAARKEEMGPEQQREAVTAFKDKLEVLKGEVREIARARRQEEVEATKFVLDTMIAGEIWLDPGYRSNLAQLSTVLPRPEREALYEENRKKDGLSAAAMNLIPVLGLGSWKQRDLFGAVITNLSGLMGATLLWLGTGDVLGQDAPPQVEVASMYLGIGLLAAGEIFAISRPFLYARTQNRKLGQALGLAEIKAPESTEHYASLKRFYLLFDAGSAIMLGPRLEAGLKIFPETTVGAEVFFPAFGLMWQIGHMDESGFTVLPKSIGAGVNASYFFQRRHSPHRLHIGCHADFLWNWMLEDEGTALEENAYSGLLFIIPTIGYRLRYASGFFLSFGVGFGAGKEMWERWWFSSSPDMVYQGELEVIPMVSINLCLGWEF